MATTGVVDVKDLTIYLDDKGSSSYAAIACATDASLEASRDMREILCKDTGGGVDYEYGVFRFTLSGSGLFALDAANEGGIELMDRLIAGTKVAFKFSTEVSGDSYWSGTGLLTSVGFNSSGASGENATYSFSIQGESTLTKATVSA